MPTNFRIQLSTEMLEAIKTQTGAIEADRAAGTTVSYADFVENLGKPLESAALELHHHTTGLAGEAGELLDASKKVWIYGKPVDVVNLLEEMGDARWYYQALLNMTGLTDDDIVAINTAKLIKRFPSGQYSNAQAIARADKVGDQSPAPAVPAAPVAEPVAAAVPTVQPAPGADRKFMGQSTTQTSDAEFPHSPNKAERAALRAKQLNALDGQK